MQKKITAILTALILTITTINAQAIQTRGARSYGVGIGDKRNVISEAWVLGYLSGIAVETRMVTKSDPRLVPNPPAKV